MREYCAVRYQQRESEYSPYYEEKVEFYGRNKNSAIASAKRLCLRDDVKDVELVSLEPKKSVRVEIQVGEL